MRSGDSLGAIFAPLTVQRSPPVCDYDAGFLLGGAAFRGPFLSVLGGGISIPCPSSAVPTAGASGPFQRGLVL